MKSPLRFFVSLCFFFNNLALPSLAVLVASLPSVVKEQATTTKTVSCLHRPSDTLCRVFYAVIHSTNDPIILCFISQPRKLVFFKNSTHPLVKENKLFWNKNKTELNLVSAFLKKIRFTPPPVLYRTLPSILLSSRGKCGFL